MLNNATPSRPSGRRRSADASATRARTSPHNLDSAGTVRLDAPAVAHLRKPLAA